MPTSNRSRRNNLWDFLRLLSTQYSAPPWHHIRPMFRDLATEIHAIYPGLLAPNQRAPGAFNKISWNRLSPACQRLTSMRFQWDSLLSLSILALLSLEAFAIQVAVPPAPPGGTVVQANFLGISFELSFSDKYCKLWLELCFALLANKSKSEAMSILHQHHSLITSKSIRLTYPQSHCACVLEEMP